MIIQAYNDGNVSIFRSHQLICSFAVGPPLKKKVDSHLKLLKMKRQSKWQNAEFGIWSHIRFIR